MTREIDFLGNTAPWGDKSFENTLIVDIEDWIMVKYWPNALIVTGSEYRDHTFYCNKKKDIITENKKMPFYGLMSYYDLEIEVNNDS